MTSRQIAVGAIVWAAIGAGVALATVPEVNDDVRIAVAVASVVFPACAVVAAAEFLRNHIRVGGLSLLVSAATPTYFAWALNVPALILGAALVALPHLVCPSVTRAR